MNPSLIFQCNSELLEGPVFDHKENLLYFVSILDCLVFCYNPSTKEILSVKLDSPVSCVFLLDRKRIMVASKSGFFEVDFNTLQKKFSFQIDIANSVRYNDGIKDPKGRFIIGTMGYPEVKNNIGKVFSYSEGKYKVIIKDTTISNGLAFSQDGLSLYFIDTPTKKVAKYAYDTETGDVSFESYVIEFNREGSPDGMCMDNKGMLWIAEWGGGCVSRWNPENGRKLDERQLPCLNVTSCCIDNYLNLYITTAKSSDKDDIYGGGLFYVELN
ncbi:SMP-30/gluconolactonase/LRE family protein [Flavobacteriaceae bacterium XHP0103]|uniref:SMP-30/gluconolactonase/LRE family protein n=1 Tax=Marixanthotalea marina TaxID=2844359 RepID=UPI002989A2F4|nr:SMP-30/gluconolactonase/LRE family protein [Marixanthotalea marina]MBU3822298.1 SMP-30/gluconolactonase/LRE family protein [Marixanthotalea marina]